MARNIVLHEGQLSVAVESYEQVELAQLEAEHNAHVSAVEAVQNEVDAANTRLIEAQAAAEDSKSEYELGTSLVGVPAEAGVDATNDDGSTPVDITVADSAPEL